MRHIPVTLGACALVLSLVAAPDMGGAAERHHRAKAVRTVNSSCVRHKSNNGTLVGAVGGGVLGNVIAGRNSRTTGTLVGAGVGAVAGHQIAKKRARSRC